MQSESNKNIFYASNPAKISDALWHVINDGAGDISDMLIFLPSRRAVRGVEKMIATRMGGAALLPRLVALGEGADGDAVDDDFEDTQNDTVSDMMRVCMCARLLAADANVGSISAALPVAHDLVRMTDYLENEGVDAASVDWAALVDEKYAKHFQDKARILKIIGRVMENVAGGKMTRAARRNADIRKWIDVIASRPYSRIIVCSSTASVPATADLMAAVAAHPRGYIILPGKIEGRKEDLMRDTHPYNSEYKFLMRIGVDIADVRPIDVGPSHIEFFNRAFGNAIEATQYPLDTCHLIETTYEYEEAVAVADVAEYSCRRGKKVLVITPDAAANQRIAAEFLSRGIAADFSGGISGTMTGAGRAVLNTFDDWIERNSGEFDARMARAGGDLFKMLSDYVAENVDNMTPRFVPDDAVAVQIWDAISQLSECMTAAGITPSVRDARAFVADALGGVSVRPPMVENASVSVLGTIESRMQTADVVILTGLNDGMFPARGYQNAWLPANAARACGLPSPDRKVSLMSLDFMNLSCGPCVYWTRSKLSGGVKTSESRFLSRITAHHGVCETKIGQSIARHIQKRQRIRERPLNSGAAVPPADWTDVYVTELETLINNPYMFYAKHILRLIKQKDWWAGVDARDFGTLVHKSIEENRVLTPDAFVADMDARARDIVGADSVVFQFWHRRFLEIAPVLCDVLARMPGRHEVRGAIQIPVGPDGVRTVRAKADMVCAGHVMDFKTGWAPKDDSLSDGTKPQLPLEAAMLRSGGFRDVAPSPKDKTPTMSFLQMAFGDVREIPFDAKQTAEMIAGTIDRIQELFQQYTAGNAEYKYYISSDARYHEYDDLARIDD